MLDTLEDCEVYILDWSGQVQIDDCINCKIMIGGCCMGTAHSICQRTAYQAHLLHLFLSCTVAPL